MEETSQNHQIHDAGGVFQPPAWDLLPIQQFTPIKSYLVSPAEFSISDPGVTPAKQQQYSAQQAVRLKHHWCTAMEIFCTTWKSPNDYRFVNEIVEYPPVEENGEPELRNYVHRFRETGVAEDLIPRRTLLVERDLIAQPGMSQTIACVVVYSTPTFPEETLLELDTQIESYSPSIDDCIGQPPAPVYPPQPGDLPYPMVTLGRFRVAFAGQVLVRCFEIEASHDVTPEGDDDSSSDGGSSDDSFDPENNNPNFHY